MRWNTVLLAPIAGLFLLSNDAQADYYKMFLTASCIPELGFFSIHTHGVFDPINGLNNTRNSQFLTTVELGKHPYECQLANRVMITVKGFCLSSFGPNGVGGEPCSAEVDDSVLQEVAVFANGKLIPLEDAISRNNRLRLEYGYTYMPRHIVEVTSDHPDSPVVHILHCELQADELRRDVPNPEPTGTKCQFFEYDVAHGVVLPN